MCGITGILGKPEFTKSLLGDMLSAIKHRGPDDQGELYEERFAFGMRRLSIIDLSGGHQPIWNEDNTVGIVFNGEIYNYHELHDELTNPVKPDGQPNGQRHQFRTKSDTETIVHLYEQYAQLDLRLGVGPEISADKLATNTTGLKVMLNKLRGMFGFAIFDKSVGPAGSLIIARDYFGIKPIYYRADQFGKIISFSSEIKSLLKDPNYKPEVNHAAIHNYLSFQYNPLDETCFKGIFKLKPGCAMIIDLATSTAQFIEYWRYKFADNNNAGVESAATESATGEDTAKTAPAAEADMAEKIHQVMTDSVQHHMISDVPVGAFLSGGIDSAVTVTLMQQERERLGLDPVKTFTIGFDEVSEHEQAREVSDKLKTDHHEIKVSFDEYFKELPQIAWYFDEPVADPSAVALYFLAREARKHVTVVLSGEGSDELFGGYNIYREPFALAKIANLPSFIKNIFIKPFTKLPFNFYGKNYLRRALTSFNDRYIGNAYIFRPDEVKQLWKKDIQLQAGAHSGPISEMADIITKRHVQPGIALDQELGATEFTSQLESRKMQLVDIHYWMRGDILAKADKMTMAHSLELRVPYLDREVANLSETIPDELKYKEGKTKYILRKAFEPILPKTTADRKKLGFPTPVKHWLKKQPDEVKRIVGNNKYIREYFEPTYIENLFNQHISGKKDNSRKIYILLMLALWYNQFIG